MKKTVLVVGAGLAGLAAAHELQKYSSSFEVIIVEASKTIGGRIQTIYTNDGVRLEFGAQYEQASLEDIFERKSSRNTIDCFSVGSSCQDEDLELSALEIGKACFESCEEELFEKRSIHTKNVDSVGDYFVEYWREHALQYGNNVPLMELGKSVFIYRMNLLSRCEGSSTLFDLDFQHLRKPIQSGRYEPFEATNEKEFFGVIQPLLQGVGPTLYLQHKLCQLQFGNEDGPVAKVTCENQSTFNADHVIITVSPEVLKSFVSDQVISPRLPDWKISAINSLHLSQFTKVFFKFKQRCHRKLQSFQFYPRMNLNVDGFEPIKRVTGITRIRDSDWWLLWLPGELTEVCTKNKSHFLVTIVNQLCALYPKLRGYEVDTDHIHLSSWTTDPCFKGCWSYLRKGVDYKCLENIATPLRYDETENQLLKCSVDDWDIPHLLFAGEATHQKHLSTMRGAYASGIRAANNVLEFYNL